METADWKRPRMKSLGTVYEVQKREVATEKTEDSCMQGQPKVELERKQAEPPAGDQVAMQRKERREKVFNGDSDTANTAPARTAASARVLVPTPVQSF